MASKEWITERWHAMRNAPNPLRSNAMLFLVVVAALIAQLPHTQHVYRIVAHSEGDGLAMITPWVFAIALDLAVLVFVARARTNQSWAFAAYAMLINFCYYFWPQGYWVWPGTKAFPMLLLSIGLPTVIALYSHELLGNNNEHAPGPSIRDQAVKLTRAVAANIRGVQGATEQPAQVPQSDSETHTEPPERSGEVGELSRYKELYGDITDTEARIQAAVVMREDYGLNNRQIGEVFDVTGATVGRWFKKIKENGYHAEGI